MRPSDRRRHKKENGTLIRPEVGCLHDIGMDTIIYIHGFNSAGNSAKPEALRKMFPGVNIVAPTFDYKNPAAVQKNLESLCLTRRPKLIIGTSLGGFFALLCGASHHYPAMAINPTTKPSETLARNIGKNKNYVTGKQYIFTEQDIEKYRKLEEEQFNSIVLEDELTCFVLATDDERLGDHTYLESRYPQCKNFNYFDGQGHRFGSLKPIRHLISSFLAK